MSSTCTAALDRKSTKSPVRIAAFTVQSGCDDDAKSQNTAWTLSRNVLARILAATIELQQLDDWAFLVANEQSCPLESDTATGPRLLIQSSH
jgi:hypothetical protein